MIYKKYCFIIIVICACFSSCAQSYYKLLTHNDVAYWTHDRTCLIIEYSLKDSLVKLLEPDMTYERIDVIEAKYGEKFKFTNDTLFYYIRTDSCTIICDTVRVLSLSRNKLILKNSSGTIWTVRRLKKEEIRVRKSLQGNIRYLDELY